MEETGGRKKRRRAGDKVYRNKKKYDGKKVHPHRLNVCRRDSRALFSSFSLWWTVCTTFYIVCMCLSLFFLTHPVVPPTDRKTRIQSTGISLRKFFLCFAEAFTSLLEVSCSLPHFKGRVKLTEPERFTETEKILNRSWRCFWTSFSLSLLSMSSEPLPVCLPVGWSPSLPTEREKKKSRERQLP